MYRSLWNGLRFISVLVSHLESELSAAHKVNIMTLNIDNDQMMQRVIMLFFVDIFGITMSANVRV